MKSNAARRELSWSSVANAFAAMVKRSKISPKVYAYQVKCFRSIEAPRIGLSCGERLLNVRLMNSVGMLCCLRPYGMSCSSPSVSASLVWIILH